eukprot:m.69714 g.69714  ORF g.69714 m.69714 type:complete len:490 (-) comp8281_c0_seq4:284-1753(-)
MEPSKGTGRRGPSESNEQPAKKKKGSRDSRHRGLRHFSTCVCQKVQEKCVTSYNEVADELVQEQRALSLSQGDVSGGEPKNIKRRVYDALNVLMAIGIISKDKKKEIRWIGLPSNSEQEYKQYEDLKQKKLESIQKTKEQLFDLILQQIAFHNLIKRNEQHAEEQQAMMDTAVQQESNQIHLPFIVIKTNKDTSINCDMSRDKTEYMFRFDAPFEIHDDVHVLKRMGLAFGIENGTCSDEDVENAKRIIPQPAWAYLDEMVLAARKKRMWREQQQQQLHQQQQDEYLYAMTSPPPPPMPSAPIPSSSATTTTTAPATSATSTTTTATISPTTTEMPQTFDPNNPCVPCEFLREEFIVCAEMDTASCSFGAKNPMDIIFTNQTCLVLANVECYGPYPYETCSRTDNMTSRAFVRRVPCVKYTRNYFVVALLLSIFLGFCGADRFYLGHTCVGLGKVFTLGGLGVWWIIDTILLISGVIRPKGGGEWAPYY